MMLRRSALPPMGALEAIYAGDPIPALRPHTWATQDLLLTHLDGAELSFPGAQGHSASPCCWTQHPSEPAQSLLTAGLQSLCLTERRLR